MKKTALKRKTPMKRGGPLKRTKPLKQGGPLKRTTRIRPVSKKREKKNREYFRRKKLYFSELAVKQGLAPTEKPWCEICHAAGPRMRKASDWHHTYQLGAGGALWPEPDNGQRMLALCRPCHEQVHEHPAEARKNGWLQ